MDDITAAVAALDYRTTIGLVRDAHSGGASAVEIVHATQAGLQIVGERYERQDIFLSGLIMAGDIFRGVMEIVQDDLENTLQGDGCGRVLLGTAQGDIHDLGKNMAAMAFRAFGFVVEDLGVDVAPQTFLEAALRSRPDIIGLSGLLTLAFTSMRDTVKLLHEHGEELGGTPLIVIGGATIDPHVADFVGADHWTNDAMEGVRLCQRLVESRREA